MTSGRPAFREHAKHAEGSDTTPTSYTQRVLSAGCTSHNSDKSKKRLRSPAGPRRLGTATRISASLLRRLSAFFGSTSRPRSQSGKVRRSDTRPGDVCERAERSEGSDSGPVRKAPVSAYFAAFGSWPGVLRRTQRASGQRCAYARRCSAGVAAPLGCAPCCQYAFSLF